MTNGPGRFSLVAPKRDAAVIEQVHVRWAVKTGGGPDANLIDANAVAQTTVEALRSEAAPATWPPPGRVHPVETTIWSLDATLVGYKFEQDHLPPMQPASRQQALEAVRAFHAAQGWLPRWREWERATASRPCAKTIEHRWGWRELLAEAMGVRPNDVEVSWEGVIDDRADAMVAPPRAARNELGRGRPRGSGTGLGGGRRRGPSARTVVRHFGGWREARWAADSR